MKFDELGQRLGIDVPGRYFATDGNLTLDVIEAMRKKGFDLHIDIQCMEGGGAWVEFTDMKLSETTRIDLDAYRLSEAVARCALTALRAAEQHSSEHPK